MRPALPPLRGPAASGPSQTARDPACGPRPAAGAGEDGEVSRDALEARLSELRATVRDPRAGLFGPGSMVWQVNRTSAVFAGAGRAALLQLAHPWVAQGIADHSRTRDDPFGRFQRTFRHVFAMVFGDLDEAFRAARAVHAIHARIRGELPQRAGPFAAGTRYRANDPQSLLWVHATLWDTSLLVYETLVRPLAPEEKERYVRETRRFAALFGIPSSRVPPDWASFDAYVRSVLAGDLLCVTPVAAEMGRFVLRPPQPWLAPLSASLALLTAHWLPPRLAEDFGLERGGVGGRRRAETTLATLRQLLPRLPRRLRELPASVAAERRLAGQPGRDWIGEQLSRLLVGQP